MLTSEEYLAKADEFDSIGYYSPDPVERAEFSRLAQEMRRAAIVANRREASAETEGPQAPDPITPRA